MNAAQFQEICNGTAIKWYESLLQWLQQPLSYNGISLHLQVTQGITWILALTYLQFYLQPISIHLTTATVSELDLTSGLLNGCGCTVRGFDMHEVPQQQFGAGKVHGCFRNLVKSFVFHG